MIRKDVNDALNNLKKDAPKKSEEAHIKSKFDDMSPDELFNAINSEKNSRPAPAVKKLKRISPDAQRRVSEPVKDASKKKRIVIGELPDYDAIENQTTKASKEEKTEKSVNVSEEKSKPANVSKEKSKSADVSKEKSKPIDVPKKESKEQASVPKEKKKGFFSRIVDMMYEDEDDQEDSDEISELPKDNKVSESDGTFTVEEIEENNASTLESISEALSIINDEAPKNESVKKSDSEKVSEPEKTSVQTKSSEKKPNSTSNRKKKKKKNSGNKPAENKSEVKPETKSEEKKSESKPETKSEEKKSESKPEAKSEEKKSESKLETKSEEKKSSNSEQKSKKNKKTENTDVKKNTEKKSEASEKNEKKTLDNKKKSESVSDKKSEESVSVRSEKTEKSSGSAVKNQKRNVLGLIYIILAIVGVIAIINAFISNMGGGKSSKEKFAKAVYPAVIMDINAFENPSELPNDQILSSAIWSVVIDNEKLSEYDERMGIVTIPAVDVENFAVELFGEDIPELTHTTVGNADSKFYYNAEAQSYNVQVKPDTFTYSPEVTDVSKENGNYIVTVEYVEEHPEWMDKSVSKSVEFSLSKNNSGGYKINSMKILSEGSSTD